MRGGLDYRKMSGWRMPVFAGSISIIDRFGIGWALQKGIEIIAAN
jgi:hypothetical protein